jgi:hypothetical protein
VRGLVPATRPALLCLLARPRWESDMAEPVPVTELSAFSSPNATPTEWSEARGELAGAEVYWLRPFDLMAARMSRPCWEFGSKGHCTSVLVQTNAKRGTFQRTVTASSRQGVAPSTVSIS